VLRKCLIGSVLLHILMIGMFNTIRPSPDIPESGKIFEIVRGDGYVATASKDPVPAVPVQTRGVLKQQKISHAVPQQQSLPVPEREPLSTSGADGISPESESQASDTLPEHPETEEVLSVVPLMALETPDAAPEQPMDGPSGNGIPGGADHSVKPGGNTVSTGPPERLMPDPDVPPVKIFSPAPKYPWKAKANNLEGLVVLKVEVLANGKVGAIDVETSSGHTVLDKAAKRTVKTWRYQPALKNGVPVICYIRVPIRFQLEGS